VTQKPPYQKTARSSKKKSLILKKLDVKLKRLSNLTENTKDITNYFLKNFNNSYKDHGFFNLDFVKEHGFVELVDLQGRILRIKISPKLVKEIRESPQIFNMSQKNFKTSALKYGKQIKDEAQMKLVQINQMSRVLLPKVSKARGSLPPSYIFDNKKQEAVLRQNIFEMNYYNRQINSQNK